MPAFAVTCVLLLGGLPPPGPDPVPVRRVLLPADTPPPADPTAGRMPRAAFEMLLRAAARRPDPPRLTAASYRAKLVGNDLVGNGEWAVAGRGVLPLDPLRPAVTAAAWADGRPAVLYHPPGGPPALWAETPGRVRFDWSARGTEEPGERRFDLRLPPAAVATLEIELPAAQVPAAVNADVLVTGPFPGADDAGHVWRLAFGGRPGAEFVVREPAGGGLPPAFVRAARTAKFALTPGLAEVVLDLDCESIRGPADGWLIDVDPALQVTAVTAADLDGWQLLPADPGKPARLAVRLRKPTTAGRVTLTGFAPLPADGAGWSCPLAGPAAGTVTDDTLDLRLTADLRLDGWDAGDYRLLRTAPVADGGLLLAFRGTLTANPTPTRRPPSIRGRPAAASFRTAEDLVWTVEPGRSRLTAAVKLTVTRGPLSRLRFQLPAGFTPSAVPPLADDPAAGWGRQPDGTWALDPSRPLAAGQTAELTLDLRGPGGPLAGDPAGPLTPVRAELPLPRLVPFGAEARDGTLTIRPDDRYRGWLLPPAGGPPFVLKWTGREPDGTMIVSPRTPVAVAPGEVTLSADVGKLAVIHTLNPSASAGEFGALTVFVPDSPAVRWNAPSCSPGTVRPHPAGELLPVVGLLAPMPVPAVTRLAHPGRLYRIDLSTPVRGGLTVRTTGTGPRPAALTSIPLPTLLGTDPGELDVSAGREFDADPHVGDWGFPRLDVRPRANTPAPTDRPWRLENVERETIADADGATVVLRGRVREAVGPTLPVVLPDGAVVESATVGDKWADPTGGSFARLPIPDPGDDGVSFELRYRLPARGWPLSVIDSPPPGLPTDPPDVHRWGCGDAVRLWPDGVREAFGGDRRRVVPAGLPMLIGLAAAAAVAGLALIGRRVGPLAVAVAGLGLAVLIAPDGWQTAARLPLVVAVLAVPVVWAWPRRVVLTRAAVAGLVLLPVVEAQPTDPPAVVYLLPGPAGETAVVPQGLLDKLMSLTASPVPPVAITATEYVGREDDAMARFDAVFTVVVTAPGRHPLALPLTGVRLEAMTLDGRPAYPDAAPDKYTIQAEGVGTHELKATFAVPIAAAGADRDVRFGGPDVPAARLTFVAGSNARQLTAPARRGAEQGLSGTSIRADIGSGRALHVRWRAGGPAAAKPTVTVTEAAVWDVSETEAVLTTAFVYRVSAGSLSRLELDIPPGLEPGRLTVRPLDPAAGTAALGVRTWRLSDGPPRTLVADLQTPIEGSTLVVLRCTPTAPPTMRPRLTLPSARNVSASAGYVAVRLSGLTAGPWESPDAGDFPADGLLKELPPVPELALDRRPPTKAFRRQGPTPAAVPTLHGPSDPSPTAHELTWALGPTASVEGVVRWPRDAAGSVVEFALPAGVTPTDVRAVDLAGWGRTADGVRAWFRTAAREPTVRWAGTWTGYPTDWPGPRAVDLPVPAGPPPVMRVQAADGWAAVQAGPNRFTVGPPSPVGRVRLTETLDRFGPDLLFRAELTVPGPPRPQPVAVAVSDLPANTEVKWDGPAAEWVADGRRWELTPTGGLTATVSVRLPATTRRLPRVEVRPGGRPAADVDRVLTVNLPDLDPAPDSGRRTPAGDWAIPTDEPVRLIESAPSPPPVGRPPTPTDPLAAMDPDERLRLAAGAWAVGVLALAGVAVWGPRRLGPEYLTAFGLLAAAAGGGWLLGLAAAGVLARVGTLVRRPAVRAA